MASSSAGGERAVVWLKADDLRCSICLQLLTSPATLLCGHSFCLGCLRQWAEAKAREGRERSCPNCQRAFLNKLPERNVLLELLLEQYRRAASDGALLPSARSPPPAARFFQQAAAGKPQTQVRRVVWASGGCQGRLAHQDRLRLESILPV